MNKKVSFVRETATIEKVVQLHKVALGQYFTPPTVVEFMYQMLLAIMPAKDRRNPRIIDPACGEGIFLKYVLDNKITIPHQIYGVDIDPTAETRWKELDLFGKINLYLQDGLLDTEDKKVSTEHTEEIVGRFDIVIGNPPYGGMGIKKLTENKPLMMKIRKFELWQKAKTKNKNELELNLGTTENVKIHSSYSIATLKDYPPGFRLLDIDEVEKIEKTPIEIFFLERFIQLARPGKWIAIIVPDGILANTQLQYVRDWVLGKCNLKAVVSLPRETFKFAGTTAKTSILFLQKRQKGEILDRKMEIFMAVSEYVGVNDPEKNDLPQILEKFKKSSRHRPHSQGMKSQQPLIVDPTQRELTELRCSWHPEYWDPKYEKLIKEMKKNWEICELREIILPKNVFVGDHVRESKGEKTGQKFNIKYFNTVGIMPTGYDYVSVDKCCEKTYKRLKSTQLQKNDILLACEGVGNVGKVTLVSFDPGKSCVGNITVLRPENTSVAHFVTIFLKTRFGYLQIVRHTCGTATLRIKSEDILSIKIPLLPESLQQKIESEYKKMSKYHEKAMEVKERIIRQGKTNKETEQNPEYQKNIQKAEKMLNDLICKTEEIIEGRRKDI